MRSANKKKITYIPIEVHSDLSSSKPEKINGLTQISPPEASIKDKNLGQDAQEILAVGESINIYSPLEIITETQSVKVDAEIIAHIDHIGKDGISGWALDPSSYDRRIHLQLIVDNNPILMNVADQFRQDLRSMGISDGYSGFQIIFPDSYKNGKYHNVNLKIVETGQLILKEPASILFSRNQTKETIQGVLEGIDDNLTITGWACTQETDSPQVVDVLLDGKKIAERETHLLRPDVAIAGYRTIKSGFRIVVPSAEVRGLEAIIEVKANGSNLSGSPKKLNFSKASTLYVKSSNNGSITITLEGWPGHQIEGHLIFDGTFCTTVSLRRNDNKGTLLTGDLSIPRILQDAQPHICAFEIRTGHLVLRSDVHLFRYPEYKINIDNATSTEISGWVYRADKTTPLQLSLVHANKVVSNAVANLSRPDVASTHNRAFHECGFTVKSNILTTGPQEFQLKDIETGITLADVAISNCYEGYIEFAGGWKASSSMAKLQEHLAPLNFSDEQEIGFASQYLPKPYVAPNLDKVDIIVPVYSGQTETAECIESVLAAKNQTESRIIIINDCSPDPIIGTYLDSIEERKIPNVIIIRREINGGFSEAVNIGMIVAGNHDVILLNADTVVQDEWIDRMVATARMDDRIATITPFSNNGEICTLPYICRSLPVAESELALRIDKAAARLNKGKLINLPVAIGFCMFIRRACINQIGLFDAALWGRGYGEEVDFCLKASKYGWRHVMASDVFVIHRGNVSFGNEKLVRVLEAAKKISERYPFYDKLIQRFIAADPVAASRRAINIELIAQTYQEKCVLHLTHSYGGGTAKYVKDLSDLYIQNGTVSANLTFDFSGTAELRFELSNTKLCGFYDELHSETYLPQEIDVLRSDLQKLGFKRVHVHAPFGVPTDLLEWISLNFPLDVTIHDYAWICPRVSLTNEDGKYCGEPNSNKCTSCIVRHKPHPGLKHVIDAVDGDVAAYKRLFSRILQRAETIFAGTKDVVSRLERHGLTGSYRVVPHPEPIAKQAAQTRTQEMWPKANRGSRTIRVAILGAISDIKGFHQIKHCVDLSEELSMPFHFIIFGHTQDNSVFLGRKNVTVLGKYNEDDLEGLVTMHEPNIALFANQQPETFSYTLSHCFGLNLWPIVPDFGAPAERVRQQGYGTLYSTQTTPRQILDLMLETISEVAGVRKPCPQIKYPRTLEEYTGRKCKKNPSQLPV